MVTKKFLGLALAALFLAPAAAMAQAPSDSCSSAKECKGGKHLKEAYAFKGLNLTDNQKERLKKAHQNLDSTIVASIPPRQKPAPCKSQECKDPQSCNPAGECVDAKNCEQKNCPDFKADKKQKATKEKGDKRNDRKENPRAEAMKQAKAQYLKEVKEILSADQYLQFLENSYTMAPPAPRMNAPKHKGGPKGGFHGSRNGKHGKSSKGNRGDKPGKDFKKDSKQKASKG